MISGPEAVFERPMQGWDYQVEQRTLHVLAIGIGSYKNPKFSLGIADSDARLIAKISAARDGTRAAA